MAETFGQRVKRMRDSLSYSQRELAKITSTSAGLISFIERDRNRPNYDIVRRLAMALNTTTDYLIIGDESVPVVIDGLIRRLRKDIAHKHPSSKIKSIINRIPKRQDINLSERISSLSPDDQTILSHILERIENSQK